MSNSDLIEKFTQLAIEKGLIKVAGVKEDLESGKSLDSTISNIEALYGVKPESIKGMDYEKNIAEVAHPNAVVIAPSYDKLNGLVENINERQNSILNMLDKKPNGNLTNHKLAQKELALSLVSLANYMDGINNDELRILADTCFEQLTKKAILPIVAGVAAVAALGGLIYWSQHSAEVNRGFRQNAINLNKQLDDIINSGTGMSFLKTEYREELKDQLKEVKERIKHSLDLMNVIEHVVDEIEAPKAAESLAKSIDSASKLENKQSYINAYNSFKTEMKNLEPMLKTLEENFKKEDYKHRQAKDGESFFSKVNDMLGGTLYGGKGLISDEFDDVVHAIEPFRESAKSILEIIAKAEDAEKSNVKKFEAAKSEMSSYDAIKSNAPTSNKTDMEQLMSLVKDMKDSDLS